MPEGGTRSEGPGGKDRFESAPEVWREGAEFTKNNEKGLKNGKNREKGFAVCG